MQGDWRGISRLYVPTRTPTQVASHAQKHFIRQSNSQKRKRRMSLFDIVPERQVLPTLQSVPLVLGKHAQSCSERLQAAPIVLTEAVLADAEPTGRGTAANPAAAEAGGARVSTP